jgi:putative SOS response-associated peptidase YedK
MCFHYSLTKEKAEVALLLSAQWDEDLHWQPMFHADGFTFCSMPVVTQREPNRIQMMQWGLIPHWVKNWQQAKEIRIQTLNARSETVFEKNSFRSGIRNARCLIPADGFFEWMHHQNKKYPHYISIENKTMFCFAGISSEWTDTDTGEMIQTFSILTTEANSLMARIHNTKKRMPVILPMQDYHVWLHPDIDADRIKTLMGPFPEGAMQYYTVSRSISNKKVNTNLLETLNYFQYPELQTLF